MIILNYGKLNNVPNHQPNEKNDENLMIHLITWIETGWRLMKMVDDTWKKWENVDETSDEHEKNVMMNWMKMNEH